VVSSLTGGKTGSTPTITLEKISEATASIVMHDPIESGFLFNYADSPQVTVKVKGALSQCSGNC